MANDNIYVVLTLKPLEFARLAGGAAGARLSLQDFIKKEMRLTEPRKRHGHAGIFDRNCDQCIQDGS